MEKCVIYGRVSTEQQSYDSQIYELEQYAKLRNLEVVETFSEKRSGYKDVEREEYEKMKEFVIEKGIKIILIWELSRLGRKLNKLFNEIEFFANKGINVIAKQGNHETLVDGKLNYMVVGIFGALAQQERDYISERIKRGLRDHASKGKQVGLGMMPFGYENVDGYIQINEEEAKYVREIFNMVIEQKTYRSIARYLTSKGVPTRYEKTGKVQYNSKRRITSKEWYNGTIRYMIINPFYKGLRKYNKEMIPVPAIVSENIWNKANEVAKQKVGYTKKESKYIDNYLLKAKIECGHCNGRKLRTITRIVGTYTNSFYRCPNTYRVKDKCNLTVITSTNYDNILYNALMNRKELLISMKKEQLDKFDIKGKKAQIKFYDDELKFIEKQRTKVIDMYMEDEISKEDMKKRTFDIDTKKREILANINSIENDIKDFKNKDLDKEAKKLYLKKWESDKVEVRKEFIEKYVDKVLVWNISKFDITDEVIDSTKMAPFRKELLKEWAKNHPKFGVHYIEVYAYKNNEPIRMVYYSKYKIAMYTQSFRYTQGTLTIVS